MTLEQTVRANALLDVYGGLLTASQHEVLSAYIAANESLGEIAAHTHTSRQAVADLVGRTLQKLENFEAKLHFVDKLSKVIASVEPTANSLTQDKELASRISRAYTDLIKSLED